VTGVSTILALISSSVQQEIVTKCTKHELIELLLDEFVSIHDMNFAFAFANGALATQTTWTTLIEHAFFNIFLDCNDDVRRNKNSRRIGLTKVKME
jgi:hypothetical protein